MIIWLGWLGFNQGSTMTVGDGFFGYVALTTQLAAVSGALVALAVSWRMTGKIDISAVINGFLAGLVAITAGCAFVEPWATVEIGAVAGWLVVWSGPWLEKGRIDDPVHAWFTVWPESGALFPPDCSLLRAWLKKWGLARRGFLYGGGFGQLGVQALGLVVCIGHVAACTFV
jgi:Amt family ammonium transporter